MSKVKYYYNSETLSYQKIEYTFKEKFLRFILVFLVVLTLSIILVGIYLSVPGLETPRERLLKKELTEMKLNYESLIDQNHKNEDVLHELIERDDNIYRSYFGIEPISKTIRNSNLGSVNRYQDIKGYSNADLVKDTHRRVDKLSKQITIQSKSLDEIIKLAQSKQSLMHTIPAIQPIKNDQLKRMASGYGWRTDPFTKARKFHSGMDFSAKTGTPIYATGDGVITRADSRSSGYGNHIRIDHGFGYLSLYAHLSKYNVKKGDRVKRGDIIGFVGSTGRSVAPHLHYEIHKNGKKIDPKNFYYGSLSNIEFQAMLNASSRSSETLD